MDVTAVGAGAAALLYALLALHSIGSGAFLRPLSPGRVAFVAALAGTSIWASIELASRLAPAALPTFVAAVADLLRYGLWYWLLLLLLPAASSGVPASGRSGLRHVAIGVVAFNALLLIAGFSAFRDHAGRLNLFGNLALPVFGLVLIEQLFRNVPEDFRWHAKPLCIGVGSFFLFDIYLYSHAVLLGRFDPTAIAIRTGIHTLVVPLLFLASKRRADWVAKLQVSRSAVFHTTTLLLTGIYLLFISAIGYYVREFGGSWGTALQSGIVFLALVFLAALLFSSAARARVRVFVGKHFFSYRYDYRAEWLRFTAMLSGNSSPREMGGLVVRGMANMLQSPGGALWTASPGSGEFVQAAHWNFPITAEKVQVASGFSSFLLRKAWIVDLHEFAQHPARYASADIPPWLADTRQAWLVVPLIVLDELIGFVVLAPPHAAIEVNWEVRDLLKTASRQAATFLAQMNATEALLEARKFDAFNRMSAFVVHDLKNIVTQLSLMMQNARRLQDNPEFRQDMLTTVENSLEKMRQLILQLREGETPMGVQCGVELTPIVQRLQAMSAARGRSLEVKIVDSLTASGHEDRLSRVLGHFVQNAFDAAPGHGHVWMSCERSGGMAKIVVGDNGHGMTQEFVRTRLFRPFHTTKPNGMGIGAYESFQYVRELGGSIDVQSEVGRGTVMSICLPLFATRRSSDTAAVSPK